jgi:uncharacterized protein YecT (DUF1311 family)
MRALMTMLALTCAVAPGARAESVGQRWSPRQAAQPALTESLEPELCGAVLQAAREWFDSDLASEIELTPENIGVESIEWETAEIAAGSVYRKSLDLDGDGAAERVVITGRYFRESEGFRGYVLPSEDAVAELVGRIRRDDGFRPPTVPAGGFSFFPRGSSELAYYNFYPKNLVRWHDRFFYVGRRGESPAATDLVVARFDGQNEFPIVCRISSGDPTVLEKVMLAVPEIGALLTSLNFIGRSSDMYCGTSRAGSAHYSQASAWLSLAAVRPWASVYMDDRALIPRGSGGSPAFWKFLEAWGSADSWSRREYLTLRESVEPARRAYASYLVERFGLPEREARTRGDFIIDNLLDAWIYVPAIEPDYFPAAPDPLDVRHVNEFGKTSLMTAAHLNRLDHVHELLSRGANPNAITDKLIECGYHVERGQRTALLYAAENANPLVMKALLDAGAKLTDIDSTPERGLRYLVNNPRLTPEQQRTPLDELAADAARLAEAPGFDCKRARGRVETAICANETLRMLDAEMAQAYERALPAIGAALRREQKAWNSRRALQCGEMSGRRQVDCLAEFTSARERYLHRLERR